MVRFEELQELWQNQPAPLVSAEEAVSLASAFRRYGRRQDLINLSKAVATVLQLAYLIVRMQHHPIVLIGGLVVDICVVCFLVYEWRNQRAIARLNFAAPSRDFLRTAIARLKAQRNPFRTRQGYGLLAGSWAGMTTMIAGRWAGTNTARLAIDEAVITGLLAALPPIGDYLRGKRWNLECRPLVERLTALVENHTERTR